MKDEEGLVLKAVPRDPSEEPTTATQHAAEVAEGVEKLEITPNKIADKKRKGEDVEEEPVVVAAVSAHSQTASLASDMRRFRRAAREGQRVEKQERRKATETWRRKHEGDLLVERNTTLHLRSCVEANGESPSSALLHRLEK